MKRKLKTEELSLENLNAIFGPELLGQGLAVQQNGNSSFGRQSHAPYRFDYATTTAVGSDAPASELPAALIQGAGRRLVLVAPAAGLINCEHQKCFDLGESGAGAVALMEMVRLIEKGEKIDDIVNEAKGLTFTTGNEHAVVKLTGGSRALVSGGLHGIDFGDKITRVFGHTHPTSSLPSCVDVAALKKLKQSKQYVFHGGLISIVRARH